MCFHADAKHAELFYRHNSFEGARPSMPPISVPPESTIRKALSEFQIELNAMQVSQIQEYIKLLLTWNEKVNLTAIRDPVDILHRHFCESMFATKVADLDQCRLADIGTGGGFPGLPLKILLPNAQVGLVESSVRKAAFLAEVVRSLGLDNVNVVVGRYEELGEEIAPVDFLLARALGDFRAFLRWAASASVGATQVILWLGTKDLEEVKKIEGWTWGAPAEVPKSLRRVIVLGSKSLNNN
jgi:16S rRNA (guanine527-N7)-methyltransferase